jgi:hypothetical protein
MGPRTSHRVAGLLGHSELNDCFDRFGQARERQVFEVVTLCTGTKFAPTTGSNTVTQFDKWSNVKFQANRLRNRLTLDGHNPS